MNSPVLREGFTTGTAATAAATAALHRALSGQTLELVHVCLPPFTEAKRFFPVPVRCAALNPVERKSVV
ncbi:MAG: cobalt-precorrin-5B (C(1))-methyltransferase [Desulfovibrionaceae bacterium]